jgi:hypothetical protein
MSRFPRIVVGGMFILVPLLMVAGAIWNYMLYQECRADGNKSYQCVAMLSNPNYVAIDHMNE